MYARCMDRKSKSEYARLIAGNYLYRGECEFFHGAGGSSRRPRLTAKVQTVMSEFIDSARVSPAYERYKSIRLVTYRIFYVMHRNA